MSTSPYRMRISCRNVMSPRLLLSGEAGLERLELAAVPVELDGDGIGTGATWRRPADDRHAGLEQHECVLAEVGMRGHEFGQRYSALDRVAHQAPDQRVRVTEGHA